MYKLKNLDYYLLGGTKSGYYTCIVEIDMPESELKEFNDILEDFHSYIHEHYEEYVASGRKHKAIDISHSIEADAIKQLEDILRQNNIEITISEDYPMNLEYTYKYINGHRYEDYPTIQWESKNTSKNRQGLYKLKQILNK